MLIAQKIPPAKKEKVQLQIILHGGRKKTFHFKNSTDRKVVKNFLQQLLPEQETRSQLEDTR